MIKLLLRSNITLLFLFTSRFYVFYQKKKRKKKTFVDSLLDSHRQLRSQVIIETCQSKQGLKDGMRRAKNMINTISHFCFIEFKETGNFTTKNQSLLFLRVS